MSEEVATASAHEEIADASKNDQELKRKACQLTDEPGADSLVPLPLQKWFSAVGSLGLGLGLRLGAVYSEQDLRGRCQGQQEKLTKLEQFFSDPKLLKEVPAKPAKAAKARRCELATVEERDQAVVETARKEHIGPDSCIVVGQLVWDCGVTPPRTARVLAIASEREEPYLIQYVDSSPLNAVEQETYFFVSDIRPLQLDEFLKDLNPGTSSDNSMGSARPAAVRPVPRATEPSLLGEGSVAWACGDNRAPWPVQLQSLVSPEGELEVWRVKPLGTGDTDEEEAPASQLRPFAFGDLRALAALAAETELTDATRAVRESAANGACQV